jgi:hypothetical protein
MSGLRTVQGPAHDVARRLIRQGLRQETAEHRPASYEGDSLMVTNCPQQLTATDVPRASSQGAFLSRAVARVGQWLCGLRGHDSVLHFEGKRVMMRCTSCGHDTPGWDISGRGPRGRFEGDARRHLLSTPRLVVRKSA